MASVPVTSAPIEEPVFAVIREGTALRPSIRIVGRVNGASINVPATDKAKALAAFDRLLDSFLTSMKGTKAEGAQPPVSTVISDTEKLDVLLAVAEQTARDVADVRQVLVTYQEPATDEAPTDIWEAAFSLAEEPAGLDVPLESFDAARFAEYCMFARSVLNGTKLYPDPRRVDLARALATGGPIDAQGEVYADLVTKWQVDSDVAIAALLTGLVDPYDVSFGARLERDVAQLAGTIHPETLSTGEVIPRFQRLDLEGVYRKLMPSGSGGQAGQGGEG